MTYKLYTIRDATYYVEGCPDGIRTDHFAVRDDGRIYVADLIYFPDLNRDKYLNAVEVSEEGDHIVIRRKTNGDFAGVVQTGYHYVYDRASKLLKGADCATTSGMHIPLAKAVSMGIAV